MNLVERVLGANPVWLKISVANLVMSGNEDVVCILHLNLLAVGLSVYRFVLQVRISGFRERC